MADAFRAENQELDPAPSRRDFVKALGSVALAASVPLIGTRGANAAIAGAGPTASAPAETGVARFYKSLKDDQKRTICFPFDHPLRKQVSNNWAIVKPTIGDMSKEQQALCAEIFKDLCSEDGHERFTKQMEEDYGGFERYHVAVFGEPGTEKPFEWVLTGRHNTIRADGNSVDGAAFGGPSFHGHASHTFNENARHTGNVWWYQGEQANRILKTLDDEQRTRALVAKAEPDARRSTNLKGRKLGEIGLAVADLDGRQKEMVRKLLKDMLMPFRNFDVEGVRECLRDSGGADRLRLTYYKEGDIGNDGVWDVWKLEGPAFAWYYHGFPHVHAWLDVARRAPGA